MSYMKNDQYGMYSRDVKSEKSLGSRLMGAETLIGNDVYNNSDDDLGDIKEIMLDVNTGKVSYAVLSFGGVFGIGEKLFAVPWNALKLDTVKERFTLDVSKERLADAPGFDKDHWPNMADETWQNQLHAYYGTSGKQDVRM
jgi:sporulation protein YlmC with PRC-barrel domain